MGPCRLKPWLVYEDRNKGIWYADLICDECEYWWFEAPTLEQLIRDVRAEYRVHRTWSKKTQQLFDEFEVPRARVLDIGSLR